MDQPLTNDAPGDSNDSSQNDNEIPKRREVKKREQETEEKSIEL